MKKLRRKGKLVTPAIIEMMPSLPSYMIETITYDRGKGFTGYEEIKKTLNCEVYFADSYCSWHRGTNENTNGLLREYYPKGMDFSLVTASSIEEKVNRLITRPRKCIDFNTPKEILYEEKALHLI